MINREEYDKLVDEYSSTDSIKRKIEIIGLVNELLENRNAKMKNAIEKYKESGQELPERFKEVYYFIDVNKCRLVGDSPIGHHSMVVESCQSNDITTSNEQVTYYNMDNLFKDIEELTLEHIKSKMLDQLNVKISISKNDISNYEYRIIP